MTPDLTIVVLHYNRWDLTQDCLASIDAQEIPCRYEKVLVDNGSTQDRHHGIDGSWKLVRYEDNRGHIVGQNRCFEWAQGEWVLFIANDVRLKPECILSLWKRKESDIIHQPSLFTPTGQVDNHGLDWNWPGYGLSARGNWDRIAAFTSTCYLMRKKLWQSVGGFDEHLLSSHEDIDFSLTAKRMGFRINQRKEALATHLGNATLKHQPSHTREAFHRDRLYILRKHYRGLDYWTRYLAVQLLDHLPRP